MRIAFYAPFKPIDHPRISGDVTIARDLYEFFISRGNQAEVAGRLAAKWIHLRPWRWPLTLAAMLGALRARRKYDCWLTYHTYYKAPDLLGPLFRGPGKPYFIFAGAYATKKRKRLSTWGGFQLNRRALLAADHIFSNKKSDMLNLSRIVDAGKLSYVRPGIRTEWFEPAAGDREEVRRRFGLGSGPVAVAAAMFRPGVKVEGLEWVIRACGRLARSGSDLRLLIAGDGPGRKGLEEMAQAKAPGRVVFLGELDRLDMKKAYAAGDFFVFPGINEGLGMVYLEAQCCGLPVVAFDHDGAPEVVMDNETGFITPSFDMDGFVRAIDRLARDKGRRGRMSDAARAHVLEHHDIVKNYCAMEQKMLALRREAGAGGAR